MDETTIANTYLDKSSPLKIYLSKDQVYYSFTLSCAWFLFVYNLFSLRCTLWYVVMYFYEH